MTREEAAAEAEAVRTWARNKWGPETGGQRLRDYQAHIRKRTAEMYPETMDLIVADWRAYLAVMDAVRDGAELVEDRPMTQGHILTMGYGMKDSRARTMTIRWEEPL
jgi:hypothetical protein